MFKATTVRILATRFRISITIAVAAFATAIYFLARSNNPTSNIETFVNSLKNKRWQTAFDMMSRSERLQLGLSKDQFSDFCQHIALAGWPTADKARVEEMIPYTTPGATLDTAWSLSGTHRFSVTFFRADGSSDLHTTINYRHDATGEWHPDVLSTILAISRGTPKSQPVKGLVAALTAVHLNRLKLYPHGETTSISDLNEVLSLKRRTYLSTPIHPFN